MSINSNQAVVLTVTLLLLAALRFIVQKTKIGMAMRALSFSPEAAALMGVNTDVVISFTFALGSALAAAAGILFAVNYPAIDPLMGILPGLKAFVAAVLGGIGNLPGAVLGGFIIGITETFVSGYISSTYCDAIAFGVLILILLIKPSGLLGKKELKKYDVQARQTLFAGGAGLGLLVSLIADHINPYWLFISYDIGINIILAVSLNLINGYTGQFSLGHAGFMAVGAYTAAVITNQFGELEHPCFAARFFLSRCVAGGLAAAIAGLLVGIPTLRLRGDYLAIVTLGFGEIIRVIFQNMQSVGGARGLSVMHGWTNFFWAFGFAAVTVYVVTTLVHSTYGRGFIAVRDDEVAASAMGINPTRYKVTAFVIGAFFAGIAGGLYAHSKQFITPGGFDFMQSIAIVVMVILGGMGNTIGVIIAAILLTLLPEFLRGPSPNIA